jgi:hypothetical protein
VRGPLDVVPEIDESAFDDNHEAPHSLDERREEDDQYVGVRSSYRSQSSQSILSEAFLSSQSEHPLKRSQFKVKEKSVIIWSPITIGAAFPQHIRKEKKQYMSGEFVHRSYIVPGLQNLPRGILLDMPEIQTE